MAPILSHNRRGGRGSWRRSSLRRFVIHVSLATAEAIEWYSASVEDLATVRCFLEHQEIGLSPRKMIYADIDVQSSQLPAQSESE